MRTDSTSLGSDKYHEPSGTKPALRNSIMMVLAGDGPIRRELTSMMPGAVFLGQLGGEALSTANASSDLFVFPSTTETFGNVIIEAMASGVPSICAREGSASGLVHQHGVTGVLSAPRDVKPGTTHSIWGAIEKHTMKLRGKSRLLKLFARTNVELVLHGHVHESHEYLRDGVRFLNAGGSVLHDQSPELHINIIRVSDAGIQAEIHRLPEQPFAFPRNTPIPVLTPLIEAQHHAA